MNTLELQKKAAQLRTDTIKLLDQAGSGHVGGPLGMADVFTVLYYDFANISAANYDQEDRDYILLSNGHICPIWYAVLLDIGIIPESERDGFRKLGATLQGHPKSRISGVDNSSGPLGHGLSQAIWHALALNMNQKNNTIFCLMSDGEHQEGQTWEAIMSAPKWNLDNLVAIMDYNGVQIEGSTDEIMPMGDLAKKYTEFGWNAIEVNGHDVKQIREALESSKKSDRPTMIVAHTISGKGVRYMEWNPDYHDWSPKKHNVATILSELQNNL